MRPLGISNRPVMMFHIPAVQLQEQLAIGHQLFVVLASVAASASQQTLVPATARRNIPYANQGLWTHLLLWMPLGIIW